MGDWKLVSFWGSLRDGDPYSADAAFHAGHLNDVLRLPHPRSSRFSWRPIPAACGSSMNSGDRYTTELELELAPPQLPFDGSSQ